MIQQAKGYLPCSTLFPDSRHPIFSQIRRQESRTPPDIMPVKGAIRCKGYDEHMSGHQERPYVRELPKGQRGGRPPGQGP